MHVRDALPAIGGLTLGLVIRLVAGVLFWIAVVALHGTLRGKD